jgi:excisionase family DNA binding protein
MRIGRADFEAGNIGIVYQAVLDVVPEDEAVEESELRVAYDQVADPGKPSFEEVVKNLSHQVDRRQIAGHTFYIRKKDWLSSTEVARRLGVSKRTVQAWGQQGSLIASRVGGRLRFATEAVEEWVKRTSHNPTKAQPRDSALDQVWDNEKDAQYE